MRLNSVVSSLFGSSSKFVAASLSAAVLFSACGKNETSTQSSLSTVDIPHTDSKWQSIGNCWVYAFTGWIESLALSGSQNKVSLNISESHITYLHYRSQLLSPWMGETLQTGGFFQEAADLISENGFLMEGEFIPNEADVTFSKIQKSATDYLNASLKSGLLKTDKSEATVTAELDKAFGVKLSSLKSKLKNTSDLVLSKDAEGKAVTLADAIGSWREVRIPRTLSNSASLPVWSKTFTEQQAAVLKRVKRALNDGHPVVMNWFVEFNALDTKGVFALENLKAKGVAGKQGYHSTVLEDYGVSGVNPATGEAFVVGEGEVSEELQKLALNYGQIDFIIVKNSWGGSERLDRPSYVVGGKGGFHKLNANYLFGTMARQSEDGKTQVGTESGVNSFVLPAGY
jgi:hypothetical protein